MMKKFLCFTIFMLFISPVISYAETSVSDPPRQNAHWVTEIWGDTPDADHREVSEDTFVNRGVSAEDNFSADSTLRTYTWPANTVANRILMKWDLSHIPQNATVIKARVYLYFYAADSGWDVTNVAGVKESYNVPVAKVINVDPDIATVTWNTSDGFSPWTDGQDGGTGDLAPAEDIVTVGTAHGYYMWDVTDMVQEWAGEAAPNFGMALSADDEAPADSNRYFASSDHPDPDKRPKLIVTYTTGPYTETWGETPDADHQEVSGDTFVNTGPLGDENFASDPTLKTYTWPANSVANRIFMKWDLSDIPLNAAVVKARLHLFFDEADNGWDGTDVVGVDETYEVPVAKVINVDPDIATVTWNTYDGFSPWTDGQDGGTGDLAPAEDEVAVGTTHGYYMWDVTDMVQEWASETAPNYGMALSADDEAPADSNRYFASSDHPDPDKRPKLTITYTVDPFTETWGETADADHREVSEDTYVNLNPTDDNNYSAEPFLNAYTWPANSAANRIFIKWDLSSIPQHATIIQAKLHLYYDSEDHGGGDETYEVPVAKVINVNPRISASTGDTYDGNTPWTGGKDGGTADLAPAEDRVSIGTTHGYHIWDVTDMVQEWASDGAHNFGMALTSDDEASRDSNRFFAASDHPDPDKRPKLSVTYVIPGNRSIDTSTGKNNKFPDDIGSPPKNITTLYWIAPATNIDGSPLNDLAGYKIHYGRSSSRYTNSIDVGNVTKYTLNNLPPGRWYFAVTTYDTSGNESDFSLERNKAID